MKQTNQQPIWVFKLGTSLVANLKTGIHEAYLMELGTLLKELQSCARLILVSSGAVALGMNELGWSKRPVRLDQLQMAAAVGQGILLEQYRSIFKACRLNVAQVLLTHEDFWQRKRYLNVQNTLNALLEAAIVPIINENDAISFEEIRFGDNDRLSSLLAGCVDAKQLIILTNQAGVYDQDPRENPNATLITSAKSDDPKLRAFTNAKPSAFGSGGMLSKVQAATLAGGFGIPTVITGGNQLFALKQAFLNKGNMPGTSIIPSAQRSGFKRIWLAGHNKTKGRLVLDSGAILAVQERPVSLLAVGVLGVHGDFERGDVVSGEDKNGRVVLQGIINYSSHEIQKIAGKSSEFIAEILGYMNEDELMDRNNMILIYKHFM